MKQESNGLKTVAIIQARTSSRRLPGKVLRKISKKTMLQRVVEQVKAAKEVDSVVVATSEEISDDPVAELADSIGVKCFRGSLNDVLSRYYNAAKTNNANIVVRITADCPLVSPLVIDRMIKEYKIRDADYVVARANETPGGYPRGTNVEVFSFECLKIIQAKASTKSQREHVTIYFDEHPSMFKCFRLDAPSFLARPWYRLTVDNSLDLKLIKELNVGLDESISLSEAIRRLDRNSQMSFINVPHKIVFRVDADLKIGTGNFFRCKTLSLYLETLGYSCIFLAKKTKFFASLVTEYQLKVKYLKPTECEQISLLNEIMKQLSPVAVVMDLVKVSQCHLRILRKNSGKLINIGVLAKTDEYSDIEIDGDLVSEKRFEKSGCLYYLGPKFKIPGTEPLVEAIRPISKHVKNILVYMGGTDPAGLSMPVLKCLSQMEQYCVTLVVGNGNTKKVELKTIVNRFEHIRLLKTEVNFSKMLVDADLAIVSGGLTLCECAMIGTSAIVLCQNKSQIRDAEIMAKKGTCVNLGCGRVSQVKLTEAISSLLEFKVRRSIRKRGMKLFDGRGTARVGQTIDLCVKKYCGKSVLIIGGGVEQSPLIQAARTLGMRIVCVDGNANAKCRLNADAFYHCDTKNSKKILAIARAHKVDGVVTSTESGVVSAAEVSLKMGLASVGVKMAKTFTDKYLMKRFLERLNIPTPQYKKITTLNQGIRFAEKIGYPVIIKPCDNAGARGVTLVENKDFLSKAIEIAFNNTSLEYLLVEEFLPGLEFGCEVFRQDDRSYSVLTKKIKSLPPNFVVMGHVTGVFKSQLTNFATEVAKKIALNGPINMDIIVTKDGPKLIEAGLRLGGNNLPLLYYLTCGIDTYKAAIEIAVGQKVSLIPRWKKAAAACYFQPSPGRVTRLVGFGKNMPEKTVVHVKINTSLGQLIKPVSQVNERVGSYVLVGENHKDILLKIAKFSKCNQIETTP